MDELAKQKALEIAQAIFRVCVFVKREKLKTELENAAVDLTAKIFAPDASKGEYLAYIEIIRGLERVVALAETAGEIKPVNARVLYRECGKLVSACGDSVARWIPIEEEGVDLEGFFSKAATYRNPAFLLNDHLPDGGAIRQSDLPVKQAGNSALLPDSSAGPAICGASPAICGASSPRADRAIRQSEENDNIAGLVKKTLILNKVRDNGGCRIKDLTIAFPEVNERTLRYNLQKLCEAGELVKIGGGPTVRYLPAADRPAFLRQADSARPAFGGAGSPQAGL